MKLSRLINSPLSLFGIKISKLSSLKPTTVNVPIKADIADIKSDIIFWSIYEEIKDFTMVEIERCFALYNAVKYIIRNKIDGDFVECGVWKGGSCMLIAKTLLLYGEKGRKIWLYDTFKGMTEPDHNDGMTEKAEWESNKMSNDVNGWCLAGLPEVRENMKNCGYSFSDFIFVEGKVEETIPRRIPEKLALLRLDTDWYSSTVHELTYLYPRLSKKGILIIDDYGAWSGCRKAVDDFFSNKPEVFFNRIDFTGQIIIKP